MYKDLLSKYTSNTNDTSDKNANLKKPLMYNDLLSKYIKK